MCEQIRLPVVRACERLLVVLDPAHASVDTIPWVAIMVANEAASAAATARPSLRSPIVAVAPAHCIGVASDAPAGNHAVENVKDPDAGPVELPHHRGKEGFP